MDEQSIFLTALEKDSIHDQAQWLDEACGADTQLRQRIDALLIRHRESSSFLEKPVFADMDTAVDSQENAKSLGARNQSVLKSLGPVDGTTTYVVLRDSIEVDDDWIVRPTSPEMPEQDSSSRYQMLGELARGGMGAIIKGRDTDLGRDLAIKVLLEEHKHKPEVVQRFIEEAQIGGQLQHPGIAPLYELGQFPDQRPFFSMKLVKGETLSTLLAKRENVIDDRAKLVGIFEQICQTMAYAHSRGVIHRDLKPSNVMVGAFGEVQIIDWGLAKVLSAGGVADEKKAHTKHKDISIIETRRSSGSNSTGSFGSQTKMGSVMGTPAYMPPEQALGEVDRLDERSDVFGLGAILCEILTGQPPYVSENLTEVFRMAARGKLSDGMKRLSECGADAELIDVARQCLAAEIMDRPRDANAVSECITRYLESVEARLRKAEVQRAAEAARAVEERKRRKVTVALAASVLLTCGLAASGWGWVSNQRNQRRIAATDKVRLALNEAQLHDGLAETNDLSVRVVELDKALESAKRASEFAREDNVERSLGKTAEELLVQIEQNTKLARAKLVQQQKDNQLRERLERIRLNHVDKTAGVDVLDDENNFDFATMSEQYREAFRDAGLSFENMNDTEAAKTIRESVISETLTTALDHWARSIPRATASEIASAWMSVGNWLEAAKVAKQRVLFSPDSSSHWLILGAMLAAANDQDGYRNVCKQMSARFSETKIAIDSSRIAKVCSLLPNVPALAELDTAVFEQALDQGLVPPALQGRLWGTRALLAHRQGKSELALEYAASSLANTKLPTVRAWTIAVQALSEQELGRTKAALENLERLDKLVRTLRQDPKLRESDDTALALVLLREAKEKIDPQSTQLKNPIPAILPPTGESLANLPEAVRRERFRPQLLSIANAADTNDWRKSVRQALEQEDHDALRTLALKEDAGQQPPEIIAWIGSALRDAGEFEAARDVLNDAQQANPGDFWVNYELSKCLTALRKPEEAISYARAAFSVRPGSTGAMWRVVSVLDDLGRTDESVQLFDRMISHAAMDNDEWLSLAEQLQMRGRFQQAEPCIRRVLKVAPDHAVAHGLLGGGLESQGRHEEAVAVLQRAVGLAEDDTEALFRLAIALGNAGRDDDAIAAYRQIIRLDRTHEGAHNNLGLKLRAAGEHEDAADSLRTAHKLNPVSRYAAGNLLNALEYLREMNGPTDALVTEIAELRTLIPDARKRNIDKYRSELGVNPRDVRIRTLLAAELLSDSRYKEALVEYHILAEDNPGIPAFVGLSKALRANGNFKEALNELRKATELKSTEAQENAILAVALHHAAFGTVGLGNIPPVPRQTEQELTESQKWLLDQAVVSYRRHLEQKEPAQLIFRAGLVSALRMTDRTAEADHEQQILDKQLIAARSEDAKSLTFPEMQERVRPLVALGKLDEAIELFKGFAAAHPKDMRIPEQIVDLMLQQGRTQAAKEVCEQMIKKAPRDIAGYMKLAAIHSMSGDIDLGMGVYDRALKADLQASDKPRILLTKGGQHFAAKEYDKAITILDEVLKIAPQNGWAHTFKGMALHEQGDLAAALAEYRKGVAVSPRYGNCHNCLAYYLVVEPNENGKFPNVEEALRHARTACEMTQGSPLIVGCLNTLGIVHYRKEEWPKALDALQGSLNKGADVFENWIFLAMTHWQLGNKEKAREWYAKAKAEHDKGESSRIHSMMFVEATKLIGSAE